MHSSRMRTGRSLTVCCSLLPGGGGVCLVPGGSAWSGGGFSLVWGVLPGPGGVLPGPGGFSLVRGVLPGPGGVCLGLGGSPWSGGFSGDPPLINRITDTCKNITLATTSLRPVIKLLHPYLNTYAEVKIEVFRNLIQIY